MSSDERGGKLLTKKSVFPGRTVRLFLERVVLPNGHVTELEIVHHPGAACVIPFLDDERIVLVRQFRHAAGGFLVEAPAGKLEPGEEPEDCARREVEEETGWVPGRLTALGPILTSPGFCDERIHLYTAHDLERGECAREDSEVMTTFTVGFDEALAMVADGRIQDAKTLAALARARLARASDAAG